VTFCLISSLKVSSILMSLSLSASVSIFIFSIKSVTRWVSLFRRLIFKASPPSANSMHKRALVCDLGALGALELKEEVPGILGYRIGVARYQAL